MVGERDQEPGETTMDYPLAHDENGSPLDVPATATGWLVRRHAGGRGRPGAVYDHDGRPLVVPLEATAAELRACGCLPASYRLDAVDSARRQLGVTAYTEVRRDTYACTDDDEAGPASTTGDAAVAALARAVEAMQRVQAERERAQAERERAQADMLARLIERLAPPPPPPAPRNMPDVLREYSDVQKIIKKLAPEPDDDEEAGPGSPMEMIAQLVEQVAVAVMPFLQQKMAGASAAGSASADSRPTGESASAETRAPEDAPAEGTAATGDTESTADTPGVDAGVSEVEAKLNAVFALLSREEARQVRILSERMPQVVLEQAMAQLLAMTAEEAAAELRRQLGTFGVKQAPKKAPANGTGATGGAATAAAADARKRTTGDAEKATAADAGKGAAA